MYAHLVLVLVHVYVDQWMQVVAHCDQLVDMVLDELLDDTVQVLNKQETEVSLRLRVRVRVPVYRRAI